MPDWLKPILDFLKEFGKYLVPIALVCALVLYLPAAALEHFGLTAISKEYKAHFSITLLFCASVILWNGLSFAGSLLWKKYRTRQRVGDALKRLSALTEDEKCVLRGYIEDKTKTQLFEVTDGVVGGLEVVGILHQGANFGPLPHMAYNIADFAWDYLNAHPKALA